MESSGKNEDQKNISSIIKFTSLHKWIEMNRTIQKPNITSKQQIQQNAGIIQTRLQEYKENSDSNTIEDTEEEYNIVKQSIQCEICKRMPTYTEYTATNQINTVPKIKYNKNIEPLKNEEQYKKQSHIYGQIDWETKDTIQNINCEQCKNNQFLHRIELSLQNIDKDDTNEILFNDINYYCSTYTLDTIVYDDILSSNLPFGIGAIQRPLLHPLYIIDRYLCRRFQYMQLREGMRIRCILKYKQDNILFVQLIKVLDDNDNIVEHLQLQLQFQNYTNNNTAQQKRSYPGTNQSTIDYTIDDVQDSVSTSPNILSTDAFVSTSPINIYNNGNWTPSYCDNNNTIDILDTPQLNVQKSSKFISDEKLLFGCKLSTIYNSNTNSNDNSNECNNNDNNNSNDNNINNTNDTKKNDILNILNDLSTYCIIGRINIVDRFKTIDWYKHINKTLIGRIISLNFHTEKIYLYIESINNDENILIKPPKVDIYIFRPSIRDTITAESTTTIKNHNYINIQNKKIYDIPSLPLQDTNKMIKLHHQISTINIPYTHIIEQNPNVLSSSSSSPQLSPQLQQQSQSSTIVTRRTITTPIHNTHHVTSYNVSDPSPLFISKNISDDISHDNIINKKRKIEYIGIRTQRRQTRSFLFNNPIGIEILCIAYGVARYGSQQPQPCIVNSNERGIIQKRYQSKSWACDSIERGIRALQKYQYDISLRLFQHALEIEPDALSALCGISITYTILQEYDKAKEHLKEIIKRIPYHKQWIQLYRYVQICIYKKDTNTIVVPSQEDDIKKEIQSYRIALSNNSANIIQLQKKLNINNNNNTTLSMVELTLQPLFNFYKFYNNISLPMLSNLFNISSSSSLSDKGVVIQSDIQPFNIFVGIQNTNPSIIKTLSPDHYLGDYRYFFNLENQQELKNTNIVNDVTQSYDVYNMDTYNIKNKYTQDIIDTTTSNPYIKMDSQIYSSDGDDEETGTTEFESDDYMYGYEEDEDQDQEQDQDKYEDEDQHQDIEDVDTEYEDI